MAVHRFHLASLLTTSDLPTHQQEAINHFKHLQGNVFPHTNFSFVTKLVMGKDNEEYAPLCEYYLALSHYYTSDWDKGK